MNKVLIVIGDACETIDTFYPMLRLREDGFIPVVIAPESRTYQTVLHEIVEGWTITKEWQGYSIKADLAFADVKPEEYAGIYFSGGRAPEYIRYDEDLIRITQYFFETRLPIGCVCHGVEIPAKADCVRDRKMSTVPKCRFDLEVCGGIFMEDPVTVDDHLVSVSTYHYLGEGLKEWIRLLKTNAAK